MENRIKNSIDDLVAHLEKQAQDKRLALLEDAGRQARAIHKDAHKRAQGERTRILEQYKLKAKEARSRIDAEARAKADHMLLAEKQKMIDAVIDQVQNVLHSRSMSNKLEHLKRIFDISVEKSGGQIPEVIVPAEKLESVKNLLGKLTDVTAGDFKSGFVLSFDTYNMNFETQALMSYWQEDLQSLAAHYLFEELESGGESGGDEYEGS